MINFVIPWWELMTCISLSLPGHRTLYILVPYSGQFSVVGKLWRLPKRQKAWC